ncbi:hypothetical protein Tco_0536966 [Tanacetum coccineum]
MSVLAAKQPGGCVELVSHLGGAYGSGRQPGGLGCRAGFNTKGCLFVCLAVEKPGQPRGCRGWFATIGAFGLGRNVKGAFGLTATHKGAFGCPGRVREFNCGDSWEIAEKRACFSSKNYVRMFLMALHPKWRTKVTAIEELKDLSSLALDELIGNLKVHELVMEKDSEICKGKKKRVKSIALKAKKESSDDETSTSKVMTKNILWP